MQALSFFPWHCPKTTGSTRTDVQLEAVKTSKLPRSYGVFVEYEKWTRSLEKKAVYAVVDTYGSIITQTFDVFFNKK